MKMLESTENKITKDKNGENVLHFEITEVVLVHCDIVNIDYQQDSGFLHTFFSNKPFGSLLEVSPKNYIFLKTFSSKFQAMEVQFTDRNSQSLEIEDRINLTLVIKLCNHYKNMSKTLSNKCSQELLDSAKQSTTDVMKTASKRAIHKTADATGDLIGNKIADKITSVSKKES